MTKYVSVGREVRKLMFELTPQVEPLSIDEAFMDLTGHRAAASDEPGAFAGALRQTGRGRASASPSRSGLSANKFLAKIASDLDKPRGFAVLGQDEAVAFLAGKPVGFIWGVGKVAQARLQRDGFSTVADLQRADETDLMKRYGVEGRRLWRLSRGIDDRFVNPERETKSVSAETTFERGHRLLQAAREDPLVAVGAGLVPAEEQRDRGFDGDAEAQDRGLPPPHARPFARRADAARGAHLRGRRATCSRARSTAHNTG